MDYLWSPWRYQYVSKASHDPGCIFCVKGAEDRDEANHIVHRGAHNFIILNLYPYSTGHLMVAPYEHVATLEAAPEAALDEMIQLARQAEIHLRAIYSPQGLNLGMNLGESAGAGVPGHIHMHVLPRWVADANFASVVGETRILPETLEVTWGRMREVLAK